MHLTFFNHQTIQTCDLLTVFNGMVHSAVSTNHDFKRSVNLSTKNLYIWLVSTRAFTWALNNCGKVKCSILRTHQLNTTEPVLKVQDNVPTNNVSYPPNQLYSFSLWDPKTNLNNKNLYKTVLTPNKEEYATLARAHACERTPAAAHLWMDGGERLWSRQHHNSKRDTAATNTTSSVITAATTRERVDHRVEGDAGIFFQHELQHHKGVNRIHVIGQEFNQFHVFTKVNDERTLAVFHC